MNTSLETIPQTWDDARDGQFFRISSGLFSTEFCVGGSVLLASYDPELADAQAATSTPKRRNAAHEITTDSPLPRPVRHHAS